MGLEFTKYLSMGERVAVSAINGAYCRFVIRHVVDQPNLRMLKLVCTKKPYILHGINLFPLKLHSLSG